LRLLMKSLENTHVIAGSLDGFSQLTNCSSI
jgi:hypothetical protein